MAEYKWDPSTYIASTSLADRALIILNQPIPSLLLLKRLWTSSKFQILADGGANQIFDFLDTEQRLEYLPTAVHGDLDSIRPEVRAYYEGHGVEVLRDPDQYSTDFTKCMKLAVRLHRDRGRHSPRDDSSQRPADTSAFASDNSNNNNNNDTSSIIDVREPATSTKKENHMLPSPMNVVALGGLGGRLDQAMAQLQELVRLSVAPLAPPDVIARLVLVSPQNVSFVLAQNSRNIVATPRALVGPAVGIIPLVGKAVITTRGLLYDVSAWETEFGGLVSTSNYLAADEVVVETDREVLFTVEIAKGLLEENTSEEKG